MPLFSLPRHMKNIALVIAAMSLCCAAHASGVTVNVLDANGKPLANAAVSLEPLSRAWASKVHPQVEIAQFKRQFDPRVTVVSTGTPVLFANFDTVRHHVYSFSPIKKFELKLYAGTPHAPVVFDQPGVAVIGCNIHDQMAAWIVVVDTLFHGVTGIDGRARVQALPTGKYRLKVWHPGLLATSDGALSSLEVTAADGVHTVRLEVSTDPLAAVLPPSVAPPAPRPVPSP